MSEADDHNVDKLLANNLERVKKRNDDARKRKEQEDRFRHQFGRLKLTPTGAFAIAVIGVLIAVYFLADIGTNSPYPPGDMPDICYGRGGAYPC